MSDNRVVVTGLGAVTAIGNDVDSYWKNLVAGKSGVGPITYFDTDDYPTKIAAELKDFDPTLYLDKKEARRMEKFIQYAVAASKQAVEDSKLDVAAEAEEIAVIIGSGIGGLDILEKQARNLHEKGVRTVSPFTVPLMITNMASGIVSIQTGAKGYNTTHVTACASGTHSIGDAFNLIKRGEAVAAIAGGAEAAITPLGIASFCAAKTLSTRNDEPEKASRPFDADRNGFVMGEGAGVLILEDLEHAKKRGAKIYAEVVGFGATGDAYHMTAPADGGEGGARAMALAIKGAGIKPEDVNYINAHGTSTYLNDKNETAAIKTVFGDYAKKLLISSGKSMTGHLLGAAGAIEAVASIKAIETGDVPPTINYTTPDPDCDLNYVPNKSVKAEVNYVLSNSLGFGGHNAVLAFGKYKA